MASTCKYDIDGFSKELGLSLTEVTELYCELITELHSETLKLKTSIADHDIESQKRIIHNIKGITGNYRIFDVYELSSKINDLFKSANWDQAALLLPHFFYICEIAISEIKTKLS